MNLILGVTLIPFIVGVVVGVTATLAVVCATRISDRK